MPNPKHVYPFEAAFYGVGTNGFNNRCNRCANPPEFTVTQKVGKRNRVTAYCGPCSDGLTGEVVRHAETLSSKLPDHHKC